MPLRVRAVIAAQVALATALVVSAAHEAFARETLPPPSTTLEALFTPGDTIDQTLAALIDGAKREVLVQSFSFTSRRIARALTAAHRRGIHVEVLADRGQTLEAPGGAMTTMARDGVPVWLDGNFAAAHNKVVIVDAGGPGVALVTGSYNFTSAAQFRNAENVLIVRNDAPLAAQYRANFVSLRERAVRYQPPPAKAAR